MTVGLAPPPPELLSPNPNWKKLASHLQNLLSDDVYHNIALQELTKVGGYTLPHTYMAFPLFIYDITFNS